MERQDVLTRLRALALCAGSSDAADQEALREAIKAIAQNVTIFGDYEWGGVVIDEYYERPSVFVAMDPKNPDYAICRDPFANGELYLVYTKNLIYEPNTPDDCRTTERPAAASPFEEMTIRMARQEARMQEIMRIVERTAEAVCELCNTAHARAQADIACAKEFAERHK